MGDPLKTFSPAILQNLTAATSILNIFSSILLVSQLALTYFSINHGFQFPEALKTASLVLSIVFITLSTVKQIFYLLFNSKTNKSLSEIFTPRTLVSLVSILLNIYIGVSLWLNRAMGLKADASVVAITMLISSIFDVMYIERESYSPILHYGLLGLTIGAAYFVDQHGTKGIFRWVVCISAIVSSLLSVFLKKKSNNTTVSSENNVRISIAFISLLAAVAIFIKFRGINIAPVIVQPEVPSTSS